MALPQSAVSHYRQQQAITVATAQQVDSLWASMTDDFDYSWSLIGQEVFLTTMAGQQAAAAAGLAYLPTVLDETGQVAPAVAEVNPARFAGGTRDGRPLETLLHGAVYQAKSAVASGVSPVTALASARNWLQGTVMDSVRDANRDAVDAGITARPKVTGWVRMLNPPSCKFCVNLAGKWFRWNTGFQSHKGCDCRHIPATESIAGDFTVDPYAYFRSLSEKDQNRVWGATDAQAIRDGGDIYRVVNIRARGLADDALKNTAGRNRGWQSRRWDTPSKMTINDIYDAARTRDEAIQLMRDNGFITGEQVAGGNLKGNAPSEFGEMAAGALGRGGARKGATAAYRAAVRSGVRDPLEPATQTAAERRLHQAYLAKQAVDRGSNPFAVNSARNPLTPQVRATVEQNYRRQIERLDQQPEQVRTLARILGIL